MPASVHTRRPVALSRVTKWAGIDPTHLSSLRVPGTRKRYWLFGEVVVPVIQLAQVRTDLVTKHTLSVSENDRYFIPYEDLTISITGLLTDDRFLDAPIAFSQTPYGIFTDYATYRQLLALGFLVNPCKWTKVTDLRDLYGLTAAEMKKIMQYVWRTMKSAGHEQSAFYTRYLGGTGVAKPAYVTERVVRRITAIIEQDYPSVNLQKHRPRPIALPPIYRWVDRFPDRVKAS